MKNIFIIFSFFTIVCSQNLISIVTQTHNNGELPSKIYYYQKSNNKLNLVKIEMYYENGQQKLERDFKRGKLIAWYENGQIKEKSSLRDGELNGLSITYYENGQKESEGRYLYSQKDGEWKYWDIKGEMITDIDKIIGQWCLSYSWSCEDEPGYALISIDNDGTGILTDGYSTDSCLECIECTDIKIKFNKLDRNIEFNASSLCDYEEKYRMNFSSYVMNFDDYSTKYYFNLLNSNYGEGVMGGDSDLLEGFSFIYRIE